MALRHLLSHTLINCLLADKKVVRGWYVSNTSSRRLGEEMGTTKPPLSLTEKTWIETQVLDLIWPEMTAETKEVESKHWNRTKVQQKWTQKSGRWWWYQWKSRLRSSTATQRRGIDGRKQQGCLHHSRFSSRPSNISQQPSTTAVEISSWKAQLFSSTGSVGLSTAMAFTATNSCIQTQAYSRWTEPPQERLKAYSWWGKMLYKLRIV